MRKLGSVMVFFIIGVFMISCLPKATDEESKQMCENLVKLRGEIEMVTVKDAVNVVQKDFTSQKADLEKRKTRELEVLDEELNARLGEVKDDKEKEPIKEEYTKHKQEVETRYAGKIEGLAPAKAKAEQDAKEKAQAAAQQAAEAVETCVAESQKDGVTQKVAQCRISASNTDEYWNVCR